MKKTMSVLAVLVLVGCGVAFSQAPTVWVVQTEGGNALGNATTLLRVGPTDAAGNGTTATIYGAVNEYVAFQVAVQAPSSGLTISNFTTTALTGPGGATIPLTDLLLYRESYITIKQHSPTDDEVSCGPGPYSDSNVPYCGDNGVLGSTTNIGTPNAPVANYTTFADPLIPFLDPSLSPPNNSLIGGKSTYVPLPVTVSAGNNAVFWVDTFIPLGTAAGGYSGTYTVTTSQGNTVTGNIALTVWGFTLPPQLSLKSLFDGDDNQSLGVVAGVQAELMRNRLMPDPSTSLTSSVSADVTQYGFNTFDPGYFNDVSDSNCAPSTNPGTPSASTVQAAIENLPAGLYLTDYSADPESNCPVESGGSLTNYAQSVIAYAQALHQATTSSYPNGVNNLVSQQPVSELFSDGLGTGRSAVDDWTMLPLNYDIAELDTTDVEDGGANAVASVLKHGDQIWSYNTEVQDAYSPKWELDFPPIDYRIQPGFINQSLGITGLVYWAVADWPTTKGCPNNPATSPTPTSSSGGKDWTNPQGCQNPDYPGEGILVYPGEPAGLQSTTAYAGVAPSMRLKYLRDGAQDYEYFQLLKNCGGTLSQTVLNTLSLSGTESPNWHDWTTNYENLESARLALGNQINSECSSGVTLESIAITPTSASIAAGATQAFTATGTYSTGPTQNITTSVTWTSSNTAAATIASTGVATGVAAGASNITAKLGGVTSNTAALTVTAPTLVSIAVTPTSASITAGGTQAFTATGTYSSGPTQNITSAVTWTSSSTTVATIAATGVATGVAAGTSNITAKLGGITSNTAALTVKAPMLVSIAVTPTSASITAGGTEAFTATGTYSSGPTQNITSAVTWTSSSTTVATIASTGVATGKAAGTTNVTAKSGSITSNTAALTVTAASPLIVTLTAPADNAFVSGNTTLTATVTGGVPPISVQFMTDQGNLGTAVTGSSPYTTTFNFTANGPTYWAGYWYELWAVATDSASNTASSPTSNDVCDGTASQCQ
jgi:uncharacterized protein YjdB